MKSESIAPESDGVKQSEDIWMESSLATFSGLKFLRYEKFQRKSKKGDRMYDVWRVSVSPIDAPQLILKTEVFRSTFERIKALRLLNPNAYLKVSVESGVDSNGNRRTYTYWSNSEQGSL